MNKKKSFKKYYLRVLHTILICMFTIVLKSQVVYETVSENTVYDFLDELANDKIININSSIKPYSRIYIAKKLEEALLESEKLNSRQKKELDFFLSLYVLETKQQELSVDHGYLFNKKLKFSYSPVALQFKDTNFRFSVQAVYGRKYTVNDKKEYIYHHKGGLNTYAYLGKNIGIYANLTDNYLYNEIVPSKTHLIQNQAGSYKVKEGGRIGADYSEMIGGINYSWKWGSLGLVKDNIMWGDHQNGAIIFSGRTPSYGMIKLEMNPVSWIHFNYFHAWLPSMVIDSSRSYITSNGMQRNIYRDKYLAANMISIMPVKNLFLSAGNSIIYSDKSIQIAYLIPFLFYKSVDHSLTMGTENENAQMFFNISSRNIKHLHLYASYFIDEWSFSRITDPVRHNFSSGKMGFQLSNFPIKNVSVGGEFYKANPFVYKHRVETTTFESNEFNLGYYLGDNSEDYFVQVQYRPFAFLQATLSGNYAKKGDDFEYRLIPGVKVDSYPVMKNIVYDKKELSLKIEANILKNIHFYLAYSYMENIGYDTDNHTSTENLDLYCPKIYQGITNVYYFGVNLGLK